VKCSLQTASFRFCFPKNLLKMAMEGEVSRIGAISKQSAVIKNSGSVEKAIHEYKDLFDEKKKLAPFKLAKQTTCRWLTPSTTWLPISMNSVGDKVSISPPETKPKPLQPVS